MLPITKKHYPLDLMELQTSYRNYLTRLNLSNLFIISNKYSTIDGFINSGSTTLPIEYKNRDSLSVAAYNSCMIERSKYSSLVTMAKLMDTKALFICEYSDCILLYSLDGNENMRWELMPVDGKQKEVCLMPYAPSYIISKQTRQLRDVQHLMHYIRKKQDAHYGFIKGQ